MTRNQKIAVGLAVLGLILFTVKKSVAAPKSDKRVRADVDIGTPTVHGADSEYFGGSDYGIAKEETGSERLRRLVEESNALGETIEHDGQRGLVPE